MEEFKKRLITGAVGIPLVLLIIYLGGIVYLVFVEALIILGLLEYMRLARISPTRVKMISVLAAVALGLLVTLSNGQNFPFHHNPADFLITLYLILLLLFTTFTKYRQGSWQNSAAAIFGVFYIGWNLSYLLLIREEFSLGREYIYFMFILIWIVDTSAYFVGMRWGHKKLAPSISPHKSKEGAIGAIISALIIAVILKLWLLPQKPWLSVLVLALLIAVVAQLSDLVESALKRNFEAKDSGSLVPGHGGILDRFDSFLLTSPVVYYFIKNIM